MKKYMSTKVEHEKVMQILEAAQYAPSAGNLQNWGFVVITDKQKREQISHACLEQLWMNTAPVHIAVGVETKKAKKYYGSKGGMEYAHQNGSAAMMVILLKALELGLASCWVGAFAEKQLKQLLGMPDDVVLIGIATIGYPAEEPEPAARVPLEIQTFFNRWGAKSTDFPAFTGDFSVGLQDKIKKAKEKIKETLKAK